VYTTLLIISRASILPQVGMGWGVALLHRRHAACVKWILIGPGSLCGAWEPFAELLPMLHPPGPRNACPMAQDSPGPGCPGDGRPFDEERVKRHAAERMRFTCPSVTAGFGFIEAR
jgi:hypothetical protein